MTPFFSIIIPVYNVAPYLRECLDSVLAQSFTNWEAICVDDGSTDDSNSILDEYATGDRRLNVIHQENAGVSAARNIALDIIQGEWVCFLDSDDVLEKSALQRIKEIISRNPKVDIVKTGLIQFKEGQCVPWNKYCGHDKFFKTDFVLPNAVLEGWFCQRCFRASLVTDVRFPPLRNGEDVVFLAHCNCKAKRIVVSNSTLYGYRQRMNSASRLAPSLLLVRQVMGYAGKTLAAYEKSNKKVASCFIRRLCNAATEDLASYIERLPRWELRVAYIEARAFWKELMHIHIVPFVQKTRLVVASIFPFRITAWCLFVLPRKLKVMGLHR